MPSYGELLQQVKGEIAEVDATRARELIDSGEPVLIDVREQDEWDEGHIPRAVHIPRGYLESRIERAAPDPARQVVLYCSGGNARLSPPRLSRSWGTRTWSRCRAASPTEAATASP